MLSSPLPIISVIIPAYNREQFLGDAIRSALQQSRCPDEILVIDDGSRDGTREVARSFGGIVRCLTQENHGPAEARNVGIREARGDLLAFLDSDDLWLPNKLESQVECLASHPETEMVFGQMQAFLSPEVAETWKGTLHVGRMPGLCASTLLARRSTFEKVGLFNPAHKVSEFIEWFSRAQDCTCHFQILPDLVLRRRVHASNSVLNRENLKTQYAKVIKEILERRRAAARGGRDLA